jgi:hypothetical protein
MPITQVFREPDRPSTNCPVFRPFIRVPYSIFLYLSDSHSISRRLSVAFLQQTTIYFIYATDFSGNRGENPCSGPGSLVTSVRILFDHISFLFFYFLSFFSSLIYSFWLSPEKNKFPKNLPPVFVTLAHGLLYSRSVPKTEHKSL